MVSLGSSSADLACTLLCDCSQMVTRLGIIWGLDWDSPSSPWGSPNGPTSFGVAKLQHGSSEIPELHMQKLPELRYHRTWLLLPSVGETSHGSVSIQYGRGPHEGVAARGCYLWQLGATGSLWIGWVSYFSELGHDNSLPASTLGLLQSVLLWRQWFFITISLWCNPHTIIFNLPDYAIQWFLVCEQSSATITTVSL